MKRLRRCGRLGDHEGHYWDGQEDSGLINGGSMPTVEYYCTGQVTIEGGFKGVK